MHHFRRPQFESSPRHFYLPSTVLKTTKKSKKGPGMAKFKKNVQFIYRKDISLLYLTYYL